MGLSSMPSRKQRKVSYGLLLCAFLGCSQAWAELTVIPQTISPSKHFALAKLPHERTLADRTVVNATLVRMPSKVALGEPFHTQAVNYDFLYRGIDEFLSSTWNPRENLVAVVCLNRKSGEIEVYRRTKRGVERLEMPNPATIALRHSPGAKEVESMLLEAKRWTHGTTLEVEIGGDIFTGNPRDAAGIMDYHFVLRVSFAGAGTGRVVSVRRSKAPSGT